LIVALDESWWAMTGEWLQLLGEMLLGRSWLFHHQLLSKISLNIIRNFHWIGLKRLLLEQGLWSKCFGFFFVAPPLYFSGMLQEWLHFT
jgi:hypothetical protein